MAPKFAFGRSDKDGSLIVSSGIFKLARNLALGVFGMAASAALANSSAAAVDITEPVRQTQSDNLTSGDTRFRQLFVSWESLDNGTADAVLVRPTISIPSQMPLRSARLSSDYGMRTHPVLGGAASIMALIWRRRQEPPFMPRPMVSWARRNGFQVTVFISGSITELIWKPALRICLVWQSPLGTA